MRHIDFALSQKIQQPLNATILRTQKGGWICSIDGIEVFLPGSQLYKEIYDYESVVGKTVKVLVQRVSYRSAVVSHKNYISKLFERRNILQNLECKQKLVGVIKHISDEGLYISVLGIIGFMPICESIDVDSLKEGLSIEFAVSKIDVEKSIFILSSKLLEKIHLKEIRAKEEAALIEKRILELNKIGLNDDVEGKIIKKYASGYIVEISENILGVLPYSETPSQGRYNIGDSIDATVFDFDLKKAYVYISVNKLIDKKWYEVKEYIESQVVPNQTKLNGKVVYIEKDIVTLNFIIDELSFFGYIKSEDLAWEKVQNAADIVFLGEELTVRFLYIKKRQLFFDLKWQQVALYPNTLYDMDTADLLASIDATGSSFIAKVNIKTIINQETGNSVISGAFASNIISLDTQGNYIQLVDKYTGVNITALIPPRYAYGLNDGAYYQFILKAAPTVKRLSEHRPYMFIAELEGGAIQIPDPFKEQVEKSFKENKTPKSNRESASYLKEIGADMYADRDRMFYELLQNADDASSLRGVKVMIQIKDNYLIFTHDGFSFSRQDFRSIVSTANSTKRLDRKKTGYKGIGFKSVFTDSEKVYIRTGGFFFFFDKNAELFKDFRAFYRKVNTIYTEDQFTKFFDENKEYENEFEGVDHLPWQLLPFWVDECPQQLQRTTFTRNCNVAIALDLGLTAEKYKDVIKGVIQNPRFMLFLRNTRRIQLEEPIEDSEDKKKWDIISIAKHIDISSGTTKLKNSFASKENELSYIVREGSEISVSNEAFERCLIPMVKECKDVAGREKWYMYQIIDNMRTPITSIPERIIAADTTTLSYAFMLDENGSAICIPDKTPSLYAYLPMEDRRYLFPFFINADFELSSNRQEAKRVSVWNEYIFYNIGKNIVDWVSSLAKPSHPLYLSLLPNHLFTEELEEGKIDRLAAQFNRGYKEALNETPFILNDKGDIVCQKDIVIDESGFANVIGSDDYCSLLGLKKRLLHKDIEIAPLTNDEIFTEVEHIRTNTIVEHIVGPQYRKQILRYWCSISSELRLSVLSHIVKMPGNKKNLSDNLLDIPAYTCDNRLFSFNRLLQSDKIILNCEIINGIGDIINKLGFKITDEVESEHPFHDKTSDAMDDYNLHVFDIIAIRTSDNSHPITAADKVKLFKHFVSAKIDHERLSQWSLFYNQVGAVKPLSKLTHIDSSIYNDITKQFVIEESEYALASHIIDRYLMKEKEQYEELIINNWDSLASEVGEDESKACSLYQLATTTYTVAEHEQAKETTKFSTDNKNFVFVDNRWLLLSEAILNGDLAENEEAKAVVELLTGKHIPSLLVTESIEKEPFKCKSQSLEKVKFLSNNCLTQEQIVAILKFCWENQDTVFANYYITKEEKGYSFKELGKGVAVGYTDDANLLSFIQKHCKEIMLLPDEFSEYKDLNGILTEDKLLLRILECIKDVSAHQSVLLPIYKESISPVKTAYIDHLSSMVLNEQSCIDKDDICIQTLLMASTIEKPENSLYDNLRNKIFITSGTSTSALSNIKLEHTVEVNGKKFPLSKLLPNEDKMAKTVDTLKERMEEFVPDTFVDKLFDEKIDKERATSVFAELNKANVTLENGTQIAFVLEYASNTKGISMILCYVNDSAVAPNRRLLCSNWILPQYKFINVAYTLNPQYGDLAKHLDLPYVNSGLKCYIQNNLVNFDYIKTSLNKQECHALLDFLLQKKEANQNISANDIVRIKTSLGISNKEYIISDNYSLEEEHLPEIIDSWRTIEDEEKRTDLLCDLFNIINEDSDVVRVRKYLTDGTPFVNSQEDSRLSKLTCNWLYKKTISLNDKQFLVIQDVIDEKDYSCEKDVQALTAFQTADYRYMSFSNYTIYLHKGQIPWIVKIKSNNYVFHRYKEGDVVILGYTIFVNDQHINNIFSLVRSLLNTYDFPPAAFTDFLDKYQAKISGSLEGEIDDDLDEDARSATNDTAKQEAIKWLSAKGYDTSNAQTEYSFVKGVRKGEIEYHIVVKSYRSRKKELKLNPNEWLYLLKANSRLMLYLGHMSFAVIDRKMLLGNHDFLRLRISSSNFSVENGNLDDTLSRLAGEIKYFERTHFVFEHVHDNILSKANSLEDYGLFKSNSDGQFTPGKDEDIL